MRRYAILAVFGLSWSIVSIPLHGSSPSAIDDNGSIITNEDPPVGHKVKFKLHDGITITGTMTAWNDEGIDGTFGRRSWGDIRARDILRLHRLFIDRNNADDWIDLGRRLLIAGIDDPPALKLAEQAFRSAKQVDKTCVDRIASARQEAEDERALRAKIAEQAAAERLKTMTPEARAWAPDVWPPLSPADQKTAIDSMRADAAAIMKKAGMSLAPVETKYFLFYSDMTRRETMKWAKELDLMYVKLAGQFALEPGENIFWGKAVIFVFKERDRFQLVEAESFHHLAPEWAVGMCHPIGPKVFVNFYRQPDTALFAAILVHETAHGFMHRFITPKRLPTWANEGFADYLASILFRKSPVDAQRRSKGLRFIRNGGNINAVLDMQYADDTWPGPDSIGYSIGYLMIELMARDKPKQFNAWVRAVKGGKDWELALKEDFGTPRAQLVDTFVRYYRVND